LKNCFYARENGLVMRVRVHKCNNISKLIFAIDKTTQYHCMLQKNLSRHLIFGVQ